MSWHATSAQRATSMTTHSGTQTSRSTNRSNEAADIPFDYFAEAEWLGSNASSIATTTNSDSSELAMSNNYPISRPERLNWCRETSPLQDYQFTLLSHPPGQPLSPPFRHIPELTSHTSAKLVELFFAEVHELLPIVHQQRYLAKAKVHIFDAGPFNCLQSAIWTLGASAFPGLQTSLYNHTRALLEACGFEVTDEACHLEYAQAWILFAYHELTRVNFHRGILSVGRCCEIVVLMRLHNIDAIDEPSDNLQDSEIEERRRTFWSAYLLDRLAGFITQPAWGPQKYKIWTRLPGEDETFDGTRAAESVHLLEALLLQKYGVNSSLAQLIISGTVITECLQQQRMLELKSIGGDILHMCSAIQPTTFEEYLSGHDWNLLDDTKSAKTMTLFANLTRYTAAFLLCITIRDQDSISTCETAVISNLLFLLHTINDTSADRIHPLTSFPLSLCATSAPIKQPVDGIFKVVQSKAQVALKRLSEVYVVARACNAICRPNTQCSPHSSTSCEG